MGGKATTGILVAATFGVVLVAACACGQSAPAPPTSVASSAPAVEASPTPIDLTLPTTLGNPETTGAILSTPSTEASLSAERAWSRSRLNPRARLTGTVLADVRMPGDSYRGKPLEGVTCWVYVFTANEPFDPQSGGPIGSSSSPGHPLIWHAVILLDA